MCFLTHHYYLLAMLNFKLIVILLIAVKITYWLYRIITRDPKYVRKAYKGKSEEQKQVIRYFLVEGCGKETISDAEYDAIIAKRLPQIKRQGLKKIGLDEDQIKEIEPVHFENFVFDNDSYYKKGEDGVWRSSKYEVTWLFFSDSQVFLYKKTMSFDEKKDKEATEEYFYKDITNFSTVSETKTITLGDIPLEIDTTQFKLVVPGESFKCAMIQNDYTEGAIQGMKAKLREKKLA